MNKILTLEIPLHCKEWDYFVFKNIAPSMVHISVEPETFEAQDIINSRVEIGTVLEKFVSEDTMILTCKDIPSLQIETMKRAPNSVLCWGCLGKTYKSPEIGNPEILGVTNSLFFYWGLNENGIKNIVTVREETIH